MTTLYYSPGACSLAPHIVLEWIGQPYTAKQIKIGSPELLALNPEGAVPVLEEDDGWVLTQNGAILEYLVTKYHAAKLDGGEGLRNRARYHQWSSFIGSDLHGAFWPFFMSGRYTTEDTQEAKDAVIAAARIQIAKKFHTLNEHLEGRDWMVGDGRGQRSAVDAYLFPMIRWSLKALPTGLDPYPNVKALFDRMSADEGVKKALADES